MIRPFKNVETARPGKSVFDLSHSKLLSADMGLLYPILCDEVIPGDHWTIGHSIVARVMPLVAPILHEINIAIHLFFCPYRLLWDSWEDFITGGVDGDDASVLPRMDYPGNTEFDAGLSLWDYLGFPRLPAGSLTATDTLPLKFPMIAYSQIWNEYYRDETHQDEIDLATPSDTLLRRAWTKDYFTSALPWAQRGTAPAFPLSGVLDIDGSAPIIFDLGHLPSWTGYDHGTGFNVDNVNNETGFANANTAAVNARWNTAGIAEADVSGLSVDLQNAVTFDVNDVREVFQIQRWMERNARCGVRYTEFLQGHFSVGGNLDARLQRPEYIGGMKAPVIISEVLQTSETGTTPQGNLAGHGITVAREFCGKYFAQEFGLIMGILSITPKPMYHQGINRQWLRRTRYDFPFPEFAQLGEQAVEDQEIYWQATDALNKHVFGFQARYDELRYKPNITVGMLRPGADFDYWTLTRDFSSLPALNSTFIECNPSNRSWAVQTGAPQFVLHVGNHIKAIRPIPAMGTPGLIDHH